MEQKRWEQYLQEEADVFTEQGEGNQRENIRREQMIQTEKQHRIPEMAAAAIKEEEITEERRIGQRKRRRGNQTWKTMFHKETKTIRDFNRHGIIHSDLFIYLIIIWKWVIWKIFNDLALDFFRQTFENTF